MSQALAVGGATSATLGDVKRTSAKQREQKGQWWRFLLIAIITLVVITPILAVLFLPPSRGRTPRRPVSRWRTSSACSAAPT